VQWLGLRVLALLLAALVLGIWQSIALEKGLERISAGQRQARLHRLILVRNLSTVRIQKATQSFFVCRWSIFSLVDFAEKGDICLRTR